MESLATKYRPRKLVDVLGHPDVVRSLQLFIKDHHPVAFLFHGETGTGKSAAAYALACELGCAVAEGPLGGLVEIASGEQTAEAVLSTMNSLRLRPLLGSGWKCLIANEADYMSRAAEAIWLDALENLRPRR